MKWYYRRGGQDIGPLETADLKKLVNRGELGPSDLVWHTEAQGWMRVAEARKLLIGSGASKSANEPTATKSQQDGVSAETEQKVQPTEAKPVDQPAAAESQSAAEPTDPVASENADRQADQPEQNAEIADLSAHRPDTSGGGAAESVRARNGGQTDVTAGIVDRLRRRMEEITGEELPTKPPPPAEPEVEFSAPEDTETRNDGTAAEPDRTDDAVGTSTEEPTEDKKPPELDLPTVQPDAGADADADSSETDVTAKTTTASAETATEPDDKAEPPVVVPPLPKKKSKPAPQAQTSPPPPPIAKPATKAAESGETPEQKPAQQKKPISAAADAKSVPQKSDGQTDRDTADGNGDGDAPSKQVAQPVRANRLPPRELVADFRPPESAFDADDKPQRNRQERPKSAKSLTTGKLRLRRSREQPEAEKKAKSPRSFLSRRSMRNAETPTSEEQSAPDSTPETSEVGTNERPPGPISDRPVRAASTEAPTSSPPHSGGPAADEDKSSDYADRANEPPARREPDRPRRNRRMSPETEQQQRPSRRETTEEGQDNVPARQRTPSGVGEQQGTKRRQPHDLAKAAAAALRRERSRAKGQDAGGADEAPAGGRRQNTAPESRPIPMKPSAPAGAQASATVDQLVQPGTGGPSKAETKASRTGSTDALPNNPPPGLRRQKGPGESSAVRSLPGRQSTGRKSGAKKSRRREGANVVPPVRQALSARNESARTRHVQGRYSLARSYWIHLVLVTGILAAAGAAGVWYLASNARIYPLVGLAAVLAVLILLIAPSQIRGVWRSANEHAKRKNGSIIARLAQGTLPLFMAFYAAAIAGLVVPAAAAAIILLKSEDERAFKVQVNRTGTIIQVDGQIDPGLTDHVDDTIRRSPRAHTVVLNSDGGYLFEARRLRDLIEASPIRATYTRTGCRGACILPFMASDERVAEVGSALQFGGPTGASGPLALVDERLGVEADRRYLEARGVDPERFDLAGFSGVNSSDRHLNLLDAGILTAVSVGNDVFRSDTVQDVSKAQVERALLTVPFFDTLARVEPELFAAFRDGVAAASLDSVETDGLGDRTFDSASPLIEHVKATYLQTAPDRPTDDLMAALIALGDILEPVNPSACVALVSPSDQTLGQSVAPFLDVDRREAYFQAFDQIIVMSGRDPQAEIDKEATAAFSEPVMASIADGNTAIETYLKTGISGSLSTEEQCSAALGYLKALRGEDLADRSAAFRQFVARQS